MRRTRIAALAVAGVLVLLFGGRWLALRYTEALWFADLGRAAQYRHLLGTSLLWQAILLLGGGLWFGAQAFGVYASIGAVHLPRRVGNLEFAEAVPRGVLRAVAAAIGLLLGAATAVTFHDLGDYVALFRAAVPVGIPEPVLGRDASFYLARLPLLETLHLLAAVAVVTAMLLASGLYALTGSLVVRRRAVLLTPHARSHLVSLLAVLGLVVAWGFQLDGYQIVAGGGGRDGALSAVDRSLRLPLCTILAGISLVVAALTVLWLRWGRGITLAALWLGLSLAAVLGRYGAPLVADAWAGPPEPTLAGALADLGDRYARAGAGVLGVRVETIPALSEPHPDSLPALASALTGVSPWLAEPDLLAAWIARASGGSIPARLWTTTVSAYRDPDGPQRLAAVAVAETDQPAARRGRERPNWTAYHRGELAWGAAPVVVRLDGASAPGSSQQGALRALAAADVGPVRFLSHPSDLGVVGENARRPGEAPVGILLRGAVRRVLLAWALQAPPLLGRRTSVADRVLYWRDVPTRLQRLYPFADFEPPRAILSGGRLVWLSVGILVSDRFPLAARLDWRGRRANFLRAAYVASVDGHTGETRLFLRGAGADTAFAAALARGAGTDVEPLLDMDPDLRAHIGFPVTLLHAQADVLARHHGEPGEAPWALVRRAAASEPGTVPARQPASFEALLTITGSRALWRVTPVTDAGGNRLVGFVAGQASGDAEPMPRLLRLPSSEFSTVAAAESRLNASPAVLGAVAASAGVDGAVHRSPVVAAPAAGTVVYLQTVFASARRLAEPLQVGAVAILAGGRIGVGADVADAARALASARSAGYREAPDEGSLAAARTVFRTLDSAARRGDWAAFGRSLDDLRRALGLPPERRP